ncbi:MAG TPA: flagellar basal body-associated FliL family protein [Solirubrobacterales bacterium]|jgi:flagellar FliL protein|nr:flagellar basal body-associated FliL family protein [Solirubrobacterales bacterium]
MKGRRKKVILIAIGVLVVAGLAYKMVLAPKSESKVKVEGTVYVMPKEFLLNLAGGRYAKLTVALVLAPGQSTGSAETTPPEGFGTLEEEPLVRQIVTDELTGASAAALTSRSERHQLQEEIRKEVDKTTDVKTKSVVFSDLVVQ